MNDIFYIGNIDNQFNKEVISILKQEFNVQIFNGKAAAFDMLVKISKPDFIFISLVAANDNLKELMVHFSQSHSDIVVVTLGSNAEASEFSEFYKTLQFENILRPTSDAEIIYKCRTAMERVHKIKEYTAKATEEDSGKKTVLIVDDNQLMLRTIKPLIDKKYDVAMAVSGAQALIVLEKKKIDLILLDYEMPVMNGSQFYSILKNNPDYMNIPVIFLTGVSTKETVLNILKMKPAGYILKPPEPDVLLAKIEEVIGW